MERRWSRVADLDGRPGLLALGAAYVAAGLVLAAFEVDRGTPVSNALFLASFVGVPGLILLYGGYRLPDTNVDPKYYGTITRWCVGAIVVLGGLIVLYHVLPAASVTNPVRAVLVITAFVVVPAFAGGYNDARAKTNAFELQRAMDLLHTSESVADVGGWQIDPETEEVFWTRHLFDILESDSEDEPPLEEALDGYLEEDRGRVEAAVEDAMVKGEPFDVEARFLTPDGTVRWLWIHGKPETVGEQVVSLRGAAQDVTERKERERELERRARQQQVIAELGQYALEVENLDELMDEACRRVAEGLEHEYCKVLELDEEGEELLLRQGVGWDDGIVGEATVSAHEDDSQAAYTLSHDHPIIVEDLETETRFSGPALLTSHGVQGGISTVIGPFDEPWGILGTHDVDPGTYTEEDVNFVQSVANVLAEAIERQQYRRELEDLVAELEESNERLEQFAYAASHDLQEPLRMVSSYLQLIERRYEDELDEDGREFLEFAIDGADRMRSMIDGLLEYSRVESKGEPFEAIDLEDVVADVRTDLGVQISETEAVLDVGELPRVRGDESQLRQLLQNLVRNAITYSGDERPVVDVSAERNGARWRVSVSDEGVGIDPADQERIFEVFQRLDPQGNPGGSGIGLALCLRIVERHGGDIRIDSEPGEGATFSFTLPDANA